MPDTTTFFGGTNGGFSQSGDAVYATARAGSNLAGGGNADLPVGQDLAAFFDIWESFLEFDTSSIPDGSTILSATLSLFGKADNSTTDFTVEARAFDYGTFAVGDFVAGASLGGLTQVATFASSGYVNEAYNAFTSDAAFLSSINKTGLTRLVLSSDRHRLGTVPSGPENLNFYGPATAGTSKDPKLVVTFTMAYEGEGTLIGVATFSAEASHHAGGEAILEGVALLTSEANFVAGGQVVLQAVARMFGEAEGVPFLDFTVYDAYIDIDGEVRGLLFFEEQNPETVSVKLQPTKQDVGNNPEEIRPDYGNFFAQADFSHGAGQRYFQQPGRDPKKFFSSEGFDIADPGRLIHLRAIAEARDSTTIGSIAQAGGLPFVVNGNAVDRGDGAFPGAWTPEDPSAADPDQAVHDIVAEGARLFAAINTPTASVRVRSSAGVWSRFQPDGATDLNVGTATRLAWLKNRLMVVGGTNARSIYEIAASSSPTPIETLPEGWTFEAIFEAGGFIHACAVNVTAGLSRVHHYGLNTGLTAIEKKSSTPWPQGQLMYTGCGFPGLAFIAGGVANSSGGYDPILYKAAIDTTNGELEYTEIRQEEGAAAADLAARSIVTMGETVLVAWSLGAGAFGGARDGIAVYHIARDAFAHHLKKTGTGTSKRISSIMPFKGRVLMSITADGLYYEDLATYTTTAILVTSAADWNNAGQKVWDQVEISHDGLPASTSIKVEYTTASFDAATTWTEIFTSDVDDSRSANGRLATVKARQFALQVTSTATASASPAFLGYSVRSLPSSVRPEFQLTRYLRLLGRDRKDEDGRIVYIDPQETLRYLQDGIYSFVDFFEAGFSWTAWLEDVSTVEPKQPFYEVTSGQPRKDVFVVRLQMTGAR